MKMLSTSIIANSTEKYSPVLEFILDWCNFICLFNLIRIHNKYVRHEFHIRIFRNSLDQFCNDEQLFSVYNQYAFFNRGE